jgi:DUF4097 and DUF4098 domain-containing protein YvlB
MGKGGISMGRQFAVVAVLSVTAVTAAHADEWNKRWQVNGAPELHITAGDSSIRVEAGGGNAVEANLTTSGWTIGDSGVRVIEHQSGNRIDIEIKEPHGHFGFGNRSSALVLRVPRQLTGDVHTGDGSIHLRGVHGEIRADTGDGSIEAEDLDGMLEARSGDGSIHIRGRFDGLRVHTGDGSVELHALPGSKMKQDWSLESGDGSLSLSLPRDLAADLDVHTGDGSIQTNAEVTVNGKIGQHDLRGKLNGGGPQLAVRTGDGSVQIDAI